VLNVKHDMFSCWRWCNLSTPNIIANVRHAWLYEFAVRVLRNKWSSVGSDYGSKKCKRSYGGVYGGVWRSLSLAEVWSQESSGRFCVGAFGGNLALVAVKMFSHLNEFKKTFYKLSTFNAFARTMLQEIVLLFKTKNSSYPSTLMCHTTLVIIITLWITTLFQKMTVAQFVNLLPFLPPEGSFRTEFTKVRHWILSRVSSYLSRFSHSNPYYCKFCLNIILTSASRCH
jgi:hypothetical protein